MIRHSRDQKKLPQHFSSSEKAELSTYNSIAGNKGETKYLKMMKNYKNFLPTNLPKIRAGRSSQTEIKYQKMNTGY